MLNVWVISVHALATLSAAMHCCWLHIPFGAMKNVVDKQQAHTSLKFGIVHLQKKFEHWTFNKFHRYEAFCGAEKRYGIMQQGH
jgi:hypothetical protein